MLVIIGWVAAAASVIVGFVLAGGHLAVLWQPIEVLVICGACLGAFLAANSKKVLLQTVRSLVTAFKGPAFTKAGYVGMLCCLYELLDKIRKEGTMAIEADVEEPEKSAIFQKYPTVLNDHHLLEFVTDYLRMMVSGNLNAHEVADVMDAELEVHHAEAHAPAAALQRAAGGLPAFGIVAAVLGVVHTMESVGQPPAILGGMIAAALVGTFLGILLAYGFVEPVVNVLETKAEEDAQGYQCVKTVLLASMNGYSPAVCVELGRKVLNSEVRPSFKELEDETKKARSKK